MNTTTNPCREIPLGDPRLNSLPGLVFVFLRGGPLDGTKQTVSPGLTEQYFIIENRLIENRLIHAKYQTSGDSIGGTPVWDYWGTHVSWGSRALIQIEQLKEIVNSQWD